MYIIKSNFILFNLRFLFIENDKTSIITPDIIQYMPKYLEFAITSNTNNMPIVTWISEKNIIDFVNFLYICNPIYGWTLEFYFSYNNHIYL